MMLGVIIAHDEDGSSVCLQTGSLRLNRPFFFFLNLLSSHTSSELRLKICDCFLCSNRKKSAWFPLNPASNVHCYLTCEHIQSTDAPAVCVATDDVASSWFFECHSLGFWFVCIFTLSVFVVFPFFFFTSLTCLLLVFPPLCI